ncbi:MAG: glycosyltransferase family 39 protein, partial [Verrucomicrobia bacterium]|nr:glycosyltransferase family 39 protein [Verrucomicrobiota bacterium]
MRSWQLYGIAALLWAAIFLPGLGDPELKGEEGRRILPARTMLRTGEWIVPFSEGKPYNRKPPMINWAIAASFKITGIENEWTARLPSVLAILAATLVILWSSRGIVTANGALVAALSFLACVAQVDKGRLAEIEALYVALTAIAMAMWLRLWHKEANPWLTYTVPWFFLGLAMLTKGPVHLLFVYGIVIATLRDSQR